MKFRLEEETLLPYDLNYSISSYLYRCLREADPDLADWLHNTGVHFRGKNYKPFVFSRCTFSSKVNQKDAMKVKGRLAFQVDSILPKVIHRMMEGAWMIGHLPLYDKCFPLQEIQLLPPVTFQQKMIYQTVSPIVVPIQSDGHVVYCHPLDSRFYDSLRFSLKNWYVLRWNEEFPEDEVLHIQLYRPEKFQLRKAAVLIRYKNKNIKGYQVPVIVETSKKMQQVIYESGLGSYGSQGFGMVQTWKEGKE